GDARHDATSRRRLSRARCPHARRSARKPRRMSGHEVGPKGDGATRGKQLECLAARTADRELAAIFRRLAAVYDGLAGIEASVQRLEKGRTGTSEDAP